MCFSRHSKIFKAHVVYRWRNCVDIIGDAGPWKNRARSARIWGLGVKPQQGPGAELMVAADEFGYECSCAICVVQCGRYPRSA